jgi:glyoxylate/hydroxypyruvate reductase
MIVHRATDAADLDPKVRKAIIVALVWGRTPRGLNLLPRLALVQAMGAGVDRLLAPGVVPEAVPIARISSKHQAMAISEYVLLHVLRQHRMLQETLNWQRSRQWSAPHSLERAKRVIGVMGLGEIGRTVCGALAAIGFEVRGLSRSKKTLEGLKCFDSSELDEFLHGCQHLVCLLPLTRETEGVLNARTFERLSTGAFLINVGRGAHLVEADLIPALDSGDLGGATLDVMIDEPVPPDHAFWSDPRILLTGHTAAANSLGPDEIAPQIAENIKRVSAGFAPCCFVDRKKGY